MRITPYLLALSVALFSACGSSTTEGDGEQTAAEIAADSVSSLYVTIDEAWATDTVMHTPESVLYHPESNTIYVANIGEINKENKDGDGFISTLTPDGSVQELKWATGLNDPKGMGIYENTLYVTDLTEIAAVDLNSGEVTTTYPVEGASFLNDITVGSDGKVYATDSDTDKIHVLENEQVSVWMEGDMLQRPNGLLMEDDRLLLASAEGGFLAPISLSDTTIGEHWVDNIPSADGIVETADGDYIVSTWQGEVHYVEPDGNLSEKILDTKDEEINAADIGYIESEKLLLVPTFFDNRVVAYKVNG